MMVLALSCLNRGTASMGPVMLILETPRLMKFRSRSKSIGDNDSRGAGRGNCGLIVVVTAGMSLCLKSFTTDRKSSMNPVNLEKSNGTEDSQLEAMLKLLRNFLIRVKGNGVFKSNLSANCLCADF